MSTSKSGLRSIGLVDVAWQHRQVRSAIDAKIDTLLTDPACDGIEFVKQLESLVRSIVGTRYAIAVHSGLAGQFLILKSLGIGSGDEVITVPNSDLATTAAISHTGAKFSLVDIEPDTFNIDPARIVAAITPNTKAIVPVHMYGLPAEMDAIREIATSHGIAVIEDATLSIGATYQCAPTGSLSKAAFFSFAPRKVIGGAGNGGMVVTDDPEVARRIRELRAYGLNPDRSELPAAARQSAAGGDHVAEGYNLKLDSIQAAIVYEKLQCLDAWKVRRQSVADAYTTAFAAQPEIVTPKVPVYSRHAWRNYVVRIPHRDRVRTMIQERGVSSAVLYIPPVHLQEVYRHSSYQPGDFPVAEAVADDLLALPMHPGLDDDEVQYVSSVVIDAVRTASQ